MDAALRSPPAKRAGKGPDILDEVRQVLLQAMSAANIALLNHSLELAMAPARTDRIAEFSIQHVPDRHAVGFVRAANFVPIMGSTAQGLVQKGFKISLFLHLELAEKHNDVIEVEQKFPWGFKARDELKSKVFAGVSERLKKWAQ